MLSDVAYNGASHLFGVAIEAADQANLEAFVPAATKVIDSAAAPLTHE